MKRIMPNYLHCFWTRASKTFSVNDATGAVDCKLLVFFCGQYQQNPWLNIKFILRQFTFWFYLTCTCSTWSPWALSRINCSFLHHSSLWSYIRVDCSTSSIIIFLPPARLLRVLVQTMLKLALFKCEIPFIKTLFKMYE